MVECQTLEIGRGSTRLGEHQLQLVTGAHHQLGSGFGADAKPVEPWRRYLSAVGFDGHLEPIMVERLHQRTVQLQQRLAAGAYHEASAWALRRPCCCNRGRELFRCREASSARTIQPYEVGITELAGGVEPVLLAAAPQVAAGKAAEDRGTPGVGAFALEGVEDFFHRVSHASLGKILRRAQSDSHLCRARLSLTAYRLIHRRILHSTLPESFQPEQARLAASAGSTV